MNARLVLPVECIISHLLTSPVAAPHGPTESVLKFDGYSLQLATLRTSAKSLGCDASHAQPHVGERNQLHAIQGPLVEHTIARESSEIERRFGDVDGRCQPKLGQCESRSIYAEVDRLPHDGS